MQMFSEGISLVVLYLSQEHGPILMGLQGTEFRKKWFIAVVELQSKQKEKKKRKMNHYSGHHLRGRQLPTGTADVMGRCTGQIMQIMDYPALAWLPEFNAVLVPVSGFGKVLQDFFLTLLEVRPAMPLGKVAMVSSGNMFSAGRHVCFGMEFQLYPLKTEGISLTSHPNLSELSYWI